MAAALLILGAAPEAPAFVQPTSTGSMSAKTLVQGQSWSPQVASPTPSVGGSSSCVFGVAGFSLLLTYAMLRRQAQASTARVAQPRVVLAAVPSEMTSVRSPAPCNSELKPELPLPSPSVCAKETLMDEDVVCEEVASVKSPVPAYSPTPVARLASAAMNASTESTSDGPSSVPGRQARFVGGARRTARHSTSRRPSPRTTCRASVKLISSATVISPPPSFDVTRLRLKIQTGESQTAALEEEKTTMPVVPILEISDYAAMAWRRMVLFSKRPNVFIKVCEKAIQEMCKELELQKDPSRKAPIQQLNIAVNTNLDGTAGTQKPKLIRELRHDQVEKLVVIQGICTAVRTPRSKVRRVVLRCTNCENVEEVYIEGGFTAAHIPAACKGNALRAGNLERCPPNSFVADASLSEYAADQRVRLQELPEHVPVGEMPRSIDLCAQMYDVDLCTPGTRLTCVGVFNASEKAAGDKLTRGRNQGTNTVKYSYVQVLGLQRAQGNRSQGALEISADEEERFEQLAKDPGIREKIFQSIAPAICATEKDVVNDVKRAVACLLFGGSRKFLPSGNRIRGDINVLLLGDPGTAKSQILKFGEKAAPISVYTSGKGSSAAGLTVIVSEFTTARIQQQFFADKAAIVKEKNGFALEGTIPLTVLSMPWQWRPKSSGLPTQYGGGAMVLADGGIALT
ncbi:mcm5 [Symbiodinium microadriaticum]|nr:mcm5 [Symbiodinium microadriaticum]